MRKVLPIDIAEYIKENRCSKKEILYLMKLYTMYEARKDIIKNEEITINDVLDKLTILSSELADSNGTNVVAKRLKKELKIIDDAACFESYSDIIDIYYETCLLMYECGILKDDDKSIEVFKKKVLERNNGQEFGKH